MVIRCGDRNPAVGEQGSYTFRLARDISDSAPVVGAGRLSGARFAPSSRASAVLDSATPAPSNTRLQETGPAQAAAEALVVWPTTVVALTRETLGLISGVAFGTLAVATMLPMSFPDKRTALCAAFVDRFAIGFVICVVVLPWAPWVVGLGLGLLLSAPSAIVTRAWRPILGMGAIGGLIIALIAERVAT